MNTNNIIKGFAAGAVLSVILVGAVTINTDLPLVGVVLGYLAAIGIFGFAAADASRHSA
jgi:hypothetical protein